MATTKLEVYNDALVLIGQRRLASLTEDRKPRRVLDDLWQKQVTYCLEQGFWKFAMRSVQSSASLDVAPAFGPAYAHERPDDFVQLYSISADENFATPLLAYMEEGNYWYTSLDTLFMRYVSKDPAFGLDLGKWPETFAFYVACRLALRACVDITESDTKLGTIAAAEKKARVDARSKDAIRQPPAFPQAGSWVRSRMGTNSGRSLGGYGAGTSAVIPSVPVPTPSTPSVPSTPTSDDEFEEIILD